MVEENKKSTSFSTILIIMVLIGVALRTYHLFLVGFDKPWGAGGLYLEFARQIFHNHYSLPVSIPHYTYGGLPFAYPPLPFYVESFLVFSLGLPEYFVVNILPPIVSILSLFLFFVLIKKVLKNKFSKLIAITLFSILPIAYIEQLPGAGLAESFGTFFIILLLIVFWSYYQNPYNFLRLLVSSLAWGLTVMASPASAYISVFIYFTLLFLLVKKHRNELKKTIIHVVLLGLFALLWSSFYWGNVIRNHGLDLLFKSFISQHGGVSFLVSFFVRLAKMDIITNEPILSLLFIASLFVLVYHNKFELLFLALFSVLIPRENWIMGIIGIIIVGYAFDLVLNNLPEDLFQKENRMFSFIIITLTVAGIFILRPLYFILTRELFLEHSLDNSQIHFLESLKEKDLPTENLIILGNDEFLEWSPYITEKSVLNVWFGTELAPSKFWVKDFHESLIECKTTSCVNEITRRYFNDETIVVVDSFFVKEFLVENLVTLELENPINVIDDRFIYFTLGMSGKNKQ